MELVQSYDHTDEHQCRKTAGLRSRRNNRRVISSLIVDECDRSDRPFHTGMGSIAALAPKAILDKLAEHSCTPRMMLIQPEAERLWGLGIRACSLGIRVLRVLGV